MCSSQPKNDKKMENNSRFGTLSGIGIVETNLSMKSNKWSLFGGFSNLNAPFWSTAVPHYMERLKNEACNDPILEFSEQEIEREREIWSL